MEIPLERLKPEIVRGLIEAYVLRDGTDYGTSEASLEEKVAHVRRQLERGQAKVVYDDETESCNIVSTQHRMETVTVSRKKSQMDDDSNLYRDVEYPDD